MIEPAILLGLGGFLGALWALLASGRRLADRIEAVRRQVEESIRNPNQVDLRKLVEELKALEGDAKTFLGLLRRVFGR